MISNVSNSELSTSDKWGMAASFVCGIHCILSPIIYLLTPALTAWWSTEIIHILGALFIIPIAVYALNRGFKQHGKNAPIVLGSIGCFLILFALLPLWDSVHPLLFTWSQGFTMFTASELSADIYCCPMVSEGTNGESIFSIPWTTIITLFGSALLITAHIKNCTVSDCKTECTC